MRHAKSKSGAFNLHGAGASNSLDNNLPGLNFVVFYYDGRRLIIREEFEKYLAEHPELRRRGFNGR